MELWPPLSGVGTVVSGEAPESDDETVHFPPNLLPSLHGTRHFIYGYHNRLILSVNVVD